LTGLFDGVAGLFADVLGRPVNYTPVGGAPRGIRSIFREAPIEAVEPGDDRGVWIIAPTWRVQRHLVPEIARGDRIQPGNGRTYTILNAEPSGSPAEDGFLICELERVFA